MPTIGASGFRFARRGSALREAVAKRDVSENQTPTVGDREGDTHPVPPAVAGTATPRLLSREESMRREQRLDSNRILARLGKDLSKARIDFEFQLESGSSDSVDDWLEIRDNIIQPAINLIPNAVKSEFLWKAVAMGMHSDFRVREFERGLAERKALSNIRETLGHYVDLVASRPDLIDVALLKVMEPINASGLTEAHIAEQKAKANLALFRSLHQTQIDSGDLDTHERQLKNGRFKNVVSDDVVQEALESLDVERRARWLSQQASDPEARNQLSSEVQVRAEFPGERGRAMAGLMRQGQALNDAGQGILLAAPSEVEQINARLRNNEDVSPEALRGFELALEERDRQLREDSQLYIFNHSPAVQGEVSLANDLAAQAENPNLAPEARASLLQRSAMHEQRAIGLSVSLQNRIKGKDAAVSALTKADAEALVSEFRALPPDRWAGKLAELDRRYGPYAGRVRTELMAAGLPGLIGTTADLLERQSPFAEDLIAVAQKPREQQVAEIGKEVANAISRRVEGKSKEFVSALRAQGRLQEIEVRLEAARRLAWQLFQTWGERNADDAAQEAVEALFPFWSFSQDLLMPMQLPADVTFRDAQFAMFQKRRAITGEMIDLSQASIFNDLDIRLDDDQMTELYADHIRGHGRWRNTCNGVQLLDGAGRPVVLKDGSFVTITWDEIEPDLVINAFDAKPSSQQ